MASKAAKLKQKRESRGRPKVEHVAREPNGRISRSPLDTDCDTLERRAKRLRLPVELARDQKAATFIGYLNLIGKVDGISDDQYEAAQKYLALRRSYLLAIKAPNAERSEEGVGTPSPDISDTYVDWCQNTVDRFDECRKVIQRAQNESRANLWAALDLCVIQGHRLDHMVGDIRILCNALIVAFRV
ncbi:hypothetical protein DEM27_10485 [Metarhizobium album]|uniref:Uncharacterized protein n=1 Tax=Metarhizobium album TaxID=2182425 RepID=A0A2U2DU16_9HYPH|nr:hypothetical protein [Rhizobium album]PWE56781.1 hypothetical protein DEM27_10485 [Rhizobium album]